MGSSKQFSWWCASQAEPEVDFVAMGIESR
jgi:hypothetical protein